MKRYWFQAGRAELIARVATLEAELSVAAALLENREAQAERRSPVVADLQAKWRDLLAEQPAVPEVAT